ncbi:MAG: XRE family transcriptional regulator [Clostridia bacterium]|nr:XRE family transcriptional regulator [Clostridia bacterium]
MNLSIEEILKILDDEQEFKMNEEAPTSNTTQAVVLVYGTIPAGIPIECIEDIIDTEEISADMLRGNKQYFGLKIKGNSMYPDYHDGDTIILEKVEDCESGQDCVVMVNGYEGTFKKVVKDEQNQTIRLQPINTSLGIDGKPLFEAITYTKEQINRLPVRIMGKVVELRRKI